MKLKSIFICLLIGCDLAMQAQELKVLEFRADLSMTDAVRFPMNDLNGNRCGLIRLGMVLPEATFEGDIISKEYKDGEWWIYMPKGSNWITIKSKTHVPLRYEFESIQSNVTYLMTVVEITGAGGKPMPTHQYLAFQISPTNAVLEVEGELWEVASDGSAMKFVNFGTYTYRVQAPNYHTEVGKVTVNDPEKTQKVIVTLKPDFVEVTLKVDADAEIWVNNEKKGTRIWTGQLGKSVYKIECKQSGHETSMITQEITADMNEQTIDLPKPTPIYGSLNIESTPSFATIYIDGKLVGETPKYISEILTGEHKIKLHVEGFRDHVETVFVNCGEKNQMQVEMRIVEAPEGAIKGIFSVSPTKKVYFSKGNLQYKESTKTWRFAESQWDYIGEKQERVFYHGWIDLFGWATSGYKHNSNKKCTIDPSTVTLLDYYYAYGSEDSALYNHTGQADWGYNRISNGGNKEKQWRTLTIAEWRYVFDTRTTSSGIRYVRGQVNGVSGIILLPDDWNVEYYELTNANPDNLNNERYQDNVIEKKIWNDLFEANGAVFLPAAGYRSSYTVFAAGSLGEYWSSNPYHEYFGRADVYASCLYFSSDYLSFTKEIRYSGESVRLVYDCQQ